MVVNDTDCHHSWNVTVMHCTDFNVAELKSLEYDKECGRYCTGTEIFIFICGLQILDINHDDFIEVTIWNFCMKEKCKV